MVMLVCLCGCDGYGYVRSGATTVVRYDDGDMYGR